MRYYVLINSTGIEEVAATELPQIPEIQKLVGIPGQEAFFEAVYGCYSDPSLAVLCDDDFLRKGYQPTLVTPTGVVLQGQVLLDLRRHTICSVDTTMLGSRLTSESERLLLGERL